MQTARLALTQPLPRRVLYFAVVLLFTGPLIFQTAQHPLPGEKVSEVGSCVKQEKNDSDISPTTSLIFAGVWKCEIWHRFLTLVFFEPFLLRNGETFGMGASMVVLYRSSPNYKIAPENLVESLITRQRVAHFVEMWCACALRVYGSSWLSRIRLAVRSGVASWAMRHWGTCSFPLPTILFLVFSGVNLTANYLSIV